MIALYCPIIVIPGKCSGGLLAHVGRFGDYVGRHGGKALRMFLDGNKKLIGTGEKALKAYVASLFLTVLL